MMSYDFCTHTHAKWILTGEHAVIRGHSDLVFPLTQKKLNLNYRRSAAKLSVNYQDTYGADLKQVLWQVVIEGARLLNTSLNDLTGSLYLKNNIPIGMGMGASAALCVAISRWFSDQNLIDSLEINAFAMQLEHLFHGKSSGLDIAGVSASTGIYFQQGSSTPLATSWAPQWFLSTCNNQGLTLRCIKQVQALWKSKPRLAMRIDQQMHDATIQAKIALTNNSTTAIAPLAQAINLAADCFRQWGLIDRNLELHMHNLCKHGAVATKPTGSGGGGYVLSLWQQSPPKFDIELMAVG